MGWVRSVLVLDASAVFMDVECTEASVYVVEKLAGREMRLIFETIGCVVAGFVAALLIFAGFMGILAKINPELL